MHNFQLSIIIYQFSTNSLQRYYKKCTYARKMKEKSNFFAKIFAYIKKM